MEDQEDPEVVVLDDESDEEAEEYNVEAIRAKRKNAGIIEYLIKWEDYPEDQNTWEPEEHLSCPELIALFNEKEKKKRKRRLESTENRSAHKRARSDEFRPEDEQAGTSDIIDVNSIDETSRVAQDEDQSSPEPVCDTVAQPKGFDRGLPIEEIIRCSVDENNRLCFLVRWSGLEEPEFVDNFELEMKAPRMLCAWYRDRVCSNFNSLISNEADRQATNQQPVSENIS